jgi:hypothetical protein
MSAARHPAAAEQPLVLVRYVDVVLVLAAFTVYFAMALIIRPAHTRSRTRR